MKKVALITGGTSGIGAATARLLVESGYQVVVTGRNATAGNVLVSELGDDKVAYRKADLMDPGVGDTLVAATIDQFGRIDALVNNGGICEVASVLDTTDDIWRRHMTINVDAAFYLSRAAIRSFLTQESGGTIVNVASSYGIGGAPSLSAYCASKGAMVLMTKSMSLEYAKQNVRVNCLCPGTVDTPMNASLAAQRDIEIEDFRKQWSDASPNGRIATSEDCANAIMFLISPQSNHVNGITLPVDGGVLAGC